MSITIRPTAEAAVVPTVLMAAAAQITGREVG